MNDNANTHRWSGWPGAWCLDCGVEDPYETALADGKIVFSDDMRRFWFTDPAEEERCKELLICKEPGSNRFNPYFHPIAKINGTDHN